MTLLLLACAEVVPAGTLELSQGSFGVVETALVRPAWSGPATLYNDGALVLGATAAVDSALVLETLPGGCAAAREREGVWRQASTDLLDASEQGADQRAFCEGMPAMLDQLAAALPAENRMELRCIDCEVEDLQSGSHAVGAEDALQLVYREEASGSVWERAADGWDADTCRMDLSEGPRLGEGLGELTVESRQDGLTGGFEGSLEVEEDTVEVLATFDAEPCEIDLSGVLFILE